MDVGSVAGSLFLIRVKDFFRYGMFDENIFLYCEEVVIGKKLQENKKKVALLTDLTYLHNHSVSISKTYRSIVSKKMILNKSKLYVLKKYYNLGWIEKIFSCVLVKISYFECLTISVYRLLRRFF